jgi:UDP-N-acetylglucosamine 2-epimerase (non-hydrolysing)
MKILVVFGTRPEAIKLAPVVLKLWAVAGFEVRVCVTGQHREMLDQVLRTFDIRPDYDLAVMRPGQSLNQLAATMLASVDEVLAAWAPDWVLVHGDTTTSFVAALAAFYHQIRVGHVEAGLRTWNLSQPWPEEGNRQLTARLASLHFAPTEVSRENLIREGVPASKIHVTGNTVIDALLGASGRVEKDAELGRRLAGEFQFLDSTRRLILVTGHRRESFGGGFEEICLALEEIAKRKDVQIVYPVHLNPKVQEPVGRILGQCKNVHLIPPLAYLSFVYLMTRSYIILTDSGGVQEEAPSLRKPVLVMRSVTERPEAVAAGTVALVGTTRSTIISRIQKLLDDPGAYSAMATGKNPYGDGMASSRIVEVLLTMGGGHQAP